MEDIAARKQAEAAQQETDRYYRALAEASFEIPYRMSADWATFLRSFIPESKSVACQTSILGEVTHARSRINSAKRSSSMLCQSRARRSQSDQVGVRPSGRATSAARSSSSDRPTR